MCPTFEWHSVAAILQSCDISNVSHIGMAWCGSHYKISHVIFQCIPHVWCVSNHSQSCDFGSVSTLEWHGVAATTRSVMWFSNVSHIWMAWCGRQSGSIYCDLQNLTDVVWALVVGSLKLFRPHPCSWQPIFVTKTQQVHISGICSVNLGTLTALLTVVEHFELVFIALLVTVRGGGVGLFGCAP